MFQPYWVAYGWPCKTKTMMLLSKIWTICYFCSNDRNSNRWQPIGLLVKCVAPTPNIPLDQDQNMPWLDTMQLCSTDEYSCVCPLTIPMSCDRIRRLIYDPLLNFANTRPARTKFLPQTRIIDEAPEKPQTLRTAPYWDRICSTMKRNRNEKSSTYLIAVLQCPAN